MARRIEAVADHPGLHEAMGGRMVLGGRGRRELGGGLRDLRVRLPDRVHTFTGRAEELAWLRQALGDTVVVTQALAGMGGIGKTALALEYAHSLFYGEHAADLVWWFSAADRLSLTTARAALYEQVTGSPTGQDSVVGAERLRNWLEECPYRWLMVFDNADGAGVLDGLVPLAGMGQVLITSRRSEWPRLAATVRSLGVLAPDDAVALLQTITGLELRIPLFPQDPPGGLPGGGLLNGGAGGGPRPFAGHRQPLPEAALRGAPRGTASDGGVGSGVGWFPRGSRACAAP